jgi:hypothetical protein
MQALVEGCARDPEAQAALRLERLVVVRQGRAGAAALVDGVGQRLEQERRVAHASGHRPEVVERPRERQRTARADAAVRRLEADDSAEGRRLADRAAGIGSDRAIAKSRGHRGGRARGRAAHRALERPGVAHRAERAHHRAAAEGELVHVQLAEQHGARGPQARHDDGIFGGDVIPEEVAGGGGPHALRVDEVLERDRDPWSAPLQRPRAISSSAARASANAPSAVTVTKEFSWRSTASMRDRHARVSSSGETFLVRTSSEASARLSAVSMRPDARAPQPRRREAPDGTT